MAGGASHKPSAANPSPSSASHRKPHNNKSKDPQSATSASNNLKPPNSAVAAPAKHKPSPKGPPSRSGPELGPPSPPAYGFHMLERRTIVLIDGSVRTYFALPPDYQDFPPPVPRFPGAIPMSPDGFDEFRRPMPGPGQGPGLGPMAPQREDYWNSLGLDGQGQGGLKRKFGDGDGQRGEFSMGATSSSPFGREGGVRGNKMIRVGGGGAGYGNDVGRNRHLEVDPVELKKAFLHYVKVVNENPGLKKKFLENGKLGSVKCAVCSRSSKDFADMHALVMHAYNSDNSDYVQHLGLHKALCVLMGWNYSKPPDNSRAYQFLPDSEAAANRDDLIIWPPTVIIHNTTTGKNKDGRMEGFGNKAMDSIIRELGCVAGKSSSQYGRDGHMGITLVKFPADQTGLREALRFAEYFERENRGRKTWARLQPVVFGNDDDRNPNLVKVDERTGEKKRIFYGYLATAFDLDKLNFESRKKVTIESRREYNYNPGKFATN